MRLEMTCAQCRDLIPRYRSGQLPAPERGAVARHVAGCAACRRELAFWSAIGEALAASEADQPIPVNQAQVWRNVRAALAQEQDELALHEHERSRGMTAQTPTPTPRTNRRSDEPPALSRRPVAAAAAFALLVVLSVVLFGVVAPRLRHTAQTVHGPQPMATPAACAPSQLKQGVPANASLSAISMDSARDGWAVGHVWDPSHPSTPPRTLMLHFQNCEWRQAGYGPAGTGPIGLLPAELTDVAMTSSSDGWAFVVTVRPESNGTSTIWVGDRGMLLHFQDGVWQAVTFPGDVEVFGARIRMASPSDGWLLVDEGNSYTAPTYTTVHKYGLYHYDGMTWTEQPMPFKTPSMILSDLAFGSGDLWIVGYETAGLGGGVIARYHMGRWSTWNGNIGGDETIALYSVALSSAQSVWAFGTHPYHDAHGENEGIAAYHFNGGTWSLIPMRAPTPNPGSFAATAFPSGGAYAFNLGYLMPGAAPIYQCDLAGCQPEPSGVDGLAEIRELALFSVTQGFAIFDRLNSAGVPQSAFLYFDGGKWRVIPSAVGS